MSREIPIITVDGPSGAGKGTLCQKLAQYYGFHLLDSGAIYRIAALAVCNLQVSIEDESAVLRVIETLDIQFKTVDQKIAVFLDGKEVSSQIRTERVGMAASKIAALGNVRAALLERQRHFAQSPGLIADGRDMGTTVFPNADVKVFLTATAEERARRRYQQLLSSGVDADFEAILSDIQLRDEQDSKRAVSPLKACTSAVSIDSSEMTIDAVFEKIVEYADSILVVDGKRFVPSGASSSIGEKNSAL
ncbi:(d)CMP kinase [Marinibactrum halimedae]|uniref:Cytidylate kinase n=1 Tax=Marinibactrum halimedae TaxID=1444977 RepID=A0AA37TBD7_9GAMM|nr:(d)CMP kinase [Marinibactrum halimedae]MCD9459827.1 (d)CMP kinase [Marinibactrum halimedae]GLS26980.1 cytidylate kinase [Marinibactrum halimedae]